MHVYYNENDPKVAAWLRELIKAGELPAGEVDERSIEDVEPTDLFGYTQCHFFAGIGGWPLALQWAGWPADRPVWTGSCPCQPFSAAGRGAGTDDPLHLWPAWRWLIDQCRPATLFGEQVASRAGRDWLAGVFTDLEALGYAAAGADLCAAGCGAPHIRQRLWWVADAGGEGARRDRGAVPGAKAQGEGERVQPGGVRDGAVNAGADSWQHYAWIPCADGKSRRIEPGIEPLVDGIPGRVGLLRGYGNAIVPQVAEQVIRAYMETNQ